MSKQTKLLEQLLSLEECGWLDFKQEMYKVADKKARDYDWQKNEMVRDILSLVNGNTHSAGKPAYLVIGAGDNRNPDGSRPLFDVGNVALPKRQIMDWANAYAEPAVEEINTHLVSYQGKRLFVIEILPSRHVHKIKRLLQTGHNNKYHENTIFMRAGDNIITAGPEQALALQRAKKHTHNINRYVNPILLLSVSFALVFGTMNWVAIGENLPSTQNTISTMGTQKGLLFLRLFFGALFGILGAGFGWSIMEFQDFRIRWVRATTKGKIGLSILFILAVVFVVWWVNIFSP